MKVLVTGASGFVGKHVVEAAANTGQQVVSVLRAQTRVDRECGSDIRFVDSIDGKTDWASILSDIEVVIHCAGLAHGRRGDSKDVNVNGVINIARQASRAGVRRLLFLSSAGVNGRVSDEPFTELDTPSPHNQYAEEKLEAERALAHISAETDLEVVIIRPPLVYGKGAPGNFGLLARILTCGLPLPLANIRNRRSFISVWNLAAFMITCMDHPDAQGKTFLVSDGESISTSDFLRLVGGAMGSRGMLFPAPKGLITITARLLGKTQLIDQLFGNLEIDDSHARAVLGWHPPLSTRQALEKSFDERT